MSSIKLVLAVACMLLPNSSISAANPAFVSFSNSRSPFPSQRLLADMSENNQPPCAAAHPFTLLPGDPSLILHTNVDLGDKKLEIMKACSKAIQAATGKPESYIGVSITDNASLIFGGSDEPAALGCVYSIGAIAMESNGKIQASVTDLLEPFGVSEDRMYINFFDMPRANVGWSRRTFAG